MFGRRGEQTNKKENEHYFFTPLCYKIAWPREFIVLFQSIPILYNHIFNYKKNNVSQDTILFYLLD